MFPFIFATIALVRMWIITMILGTEYIHKYYLAMLGLVKRRRIIATGVFKAEGCVPEAMSIQLIKKVYRINQANWPLGVWWV